MNRTIPARLAALLVVAAVAGACSSGSGSSSSPASAGSGSASAGPIEISGAWARTSPMVAGAGAAYMVIKNTGSEADTLVGASSPAAKSTEVHETYAVEASPAASMGSGTGSGSGGMASPAASMGGGMGSGSAMMGMRKIDSLEIPANGSVELKPGSYHIMMIELVEPLEVGQTIDITLTFEKAGDVTVTAIVKDM